ncbi:hypothetical protein OHA21_22920 [Actinoplanes sp. NBC_00393]|uniref:hypothetical protein n=1 Tax=Actinoplanes sp. NBC_00393 TaxID=2975953 RepID=UPI002E1E07C2
MSRKIYARRASAVGLLVSVTMMAGSAPPAAAVEPTQPTGSSAQTGAAVRAEHISFVRTGGPHNNRFAYSFSGKGNSPGARALRLASTPSFLALRPRYVPKNTCCDRFLYEIEVRYVNGRTKKVVALEDAPGIPQVLLNIIREIETQPAPNIRPPKIDFKFPSVFPFG